MNEKLLFMVTVVGVVLIVLGTLRVGSGSPGLLAAAGAYDQYGYNRLARVFNGSGEKWCLAHGRANDCFLGYSASTYTITWNQEWDRGNKDAWVLTPYQAQVNVSADGNRASVRWVGSCIEGEALPVGGTCVWGEYSASTENGSDVHDGSFGAWLLNAAPDRL